MSRHAAHRPSFVPSLLFYAQFLVLVALVETVDRVMALGEGVLLPRGIPEDVANRLALGSFALPLLATALLFRFSGWMRAAFASWVVVTLAWVFRDPALAMSRTVLDIALPAQVVGVVVALWSTMVAFADGARRRGREDLEQSTRLATAALFVIPILGHLITISVVTGRPGIVNLVLMIPIWLGVAWAVTALWRLRVLDRASTTPEPAPTM